MPEIKYSDLLRTVIAGRDLSREQAHAAFTQIMDGQWSESQIGAMLAALATKGECVDEYAGAAEAMREHSVRLDVCGDDVLDTCGTGGTGLSTFNVSTPAALICAGAGVKVAKHGNRTSTRASGSANLLETLGVNIDAAPEVVTRCLNEAGVCFCFAVRFHPAMKFAAPVRKALGVRTIFNVLGPLTNPAGARRQVMGVFDSQLVEIIARVLGALGAKHAWVFHADDGLDELSTASETKICQWKDGQISSFRIAPEDLGLRRVKLDDLAARSPEESAKVALAVLSGAKGPARDIILLNAAAGIVVADKAETLEKALPIAAHSVDSGAAQRALDKLIEISRS